VNRRERIAALQVAIDQSRIAEALIGLDLAQIDMLSLDLDKAEAHMVEAVSLVGDLESKEFSDRLELLRGALATYRGLMRQ
jgi:hypothetical protein